MALTNTGVNLGAGLSVSTNNAAKKPTTNSGTQSATGSDGLQGVYWSGSDGNIYTKNNAGQVSNMGKALKTYGTGFDSATQSSQAYRQIADPNAVAAPVTTRAVSSGGRSSGSSTDFSGINNILRNNMSLLDNIYNSSAQRAGADYNTSINERNSALNAAKQANEQQAITNDQSLLSSTNSTKKSVRNAIDSVLSALGALGMNGSTRTQAMGKIADTGNTALGTATQDWGKNKQSLAQSWGDYSNQDANARKQIADARAYAEAQAAINRDNAKKDILSQIAANLSNMGQGTGDVLSEISGLNNNISSASNAVVPTYNGVTPVYTAPSISDIIGSNLNKFAVSNKGDSANTARIIKLNSTVADKKDKVA